MQPSEPAVSNAGGLRRLLGNSLGFRETLGCRDIPAQGLTPPLHPRKGFHPLTRFRWRDPFQMFFSRRRPISSRPSGSHTPFWAVDSSSRVGWPGLRES